MESKLDVLKRRRCALDARIKLMQNRELSKARKDDTRRRILVGAYYLEQANKNDKFEDIVNLMDKFLIRDSDRKLFGLKPISK
jgi:hypothetical protein